MILNKATEPQSCKHRTFKNTKNIGKFQPANKLYLKVSSVVFPLLTGLLNCCTTLLDASDKTTLPKKHMQ